MAPIARPNTPPALCRAVQFLGASLDGASAMLVTEFMELGDLWRALPIKNHIGERVFGWYRR